MFAKYQVRKAAGGYWLLDMSQEGFVYKNPVFLNETGAAIWELLEDGKPPEQIAESFVEEYGIAKEEALADVGQFIEQLKQQGICVDGCIINRRQQ